MANDESKHSKVAFLCETIWLSAFRVEMVFFGVLATPHQSSLPLPLCAMEFIQIFSRANEIVSYLSLSTRPNFFHPFGDDDSETGNLFSSPRIIALQMAKLFRSRVCMCEFSCVCVRVPVGVCVAMPISTDVKL